MRSQRNIRFRIHHVVHVARIAWTKMTYIGIYPDTAGLTATLARLARAGVTEATAAKIED